MMGQKPWVDDINDDTHMENRAWFLYSELAKVKPE